MAKTLEKDIARIIKSSRKIQGGTVARYIPELASIPEEIVSCSFRSLEGKQLAVGDELERKYTLQSTAKLIVLIGLLEEIGNKIFDYVRMEPSESDFSSVARLDQFGPKPANPMLNDGAIALCHLIPGNDVERFAWIRKWCKILFGEELSPNMSVFASERKFGDRNRSLAFLLKSTGIIGANVEEVLESYFYLCSCEATIAQAAYLPFVLANLGKTPEGKQILKVKTVQTVLSLMATCGLYNESGEFLAKCGMPAKSSVSGFILASSVGKGGIAVMSPLVNNKGNSERGKYILTEISQLLHWHFVFSHCSSDSLS